MARNKKKSLNISIHFLKNTFMQTKHKDEKLLQIKKLIIDNHNNHKILSLHSDIWMCKYL